jgi:hypothetical protein
MNAPKHPLRSGRPRIVGSVDCSSTEEALREKMPKRSRDALRLGGESFPIFSLVLVSIAAQVSG